MQASTLEDDRRRHEDELLHALRHRIPPGVKVTEVAECGFGNGPVTHLRRGHGAIPLHEGHGGRASWECSLRLASS